MASRIQNRFRRDLLVDPALVRPSETMAPGEFIAQRGGNVGAPDREIVGRQGFRIDAQAGQPIPRPSGTINIPRGVFGGPSEKARGIQAGNVATGKETFRSPWERAAREAAADKAAAAARQAPALTEKERIARIDAAAKIKDREMQGAAAIKEREMQEAGLAERMGTAAENRQHEADMQKSSLDHGISMENLKATNDQKRDELKGLQPGTPEHKAGEDAFFARLKQEAFYAKDIEKFKAIKGLEEVTMLENSRREIAEFEARYSGALAQRTAAVTTNEDGDISTVTKEFGPAANVKGLEPIKGALDNNTNGIDDNHENLVLAAAEKKASKNSADIQEGLEAWAILEQMYGKELLNTFVKNRTQTAPKQ